jgi:hypothetical protein
MRRHSGTISNRDGEPHTERVITCDFHDLDSRVGGPVLRCFDSKTLELKAAHGPGSFARICVNRSSKASDYGIKPHAVRLIKGNPAKPDALVSTTEWITHVARASHHLDGLVVVRGITGDEIPGRMALWTSVIPS